MPSILETFYILFETDAKKAEAEGAAAVAGLATATEGADLRMVASEATKTAARLSAAAKVATAQAAVAEAELGVAGAVEARAAAEAAQAAARLAQSRAVIATTAAEALGTDRAGEAARKLGHGVGELIGQFGGLILAGLGVVEVLGSIRESFTEINHLSEEADRLGFGENVEGLNAANQVLEDYGGNADKAQRNLRRFADSISEAFGDAKSAAGKALAGIGVSAADANGDLRDTEAVMLDIAGALEKVSKGKRAATLTDLGLRDPSLRKLLLSGRANVEERFGAEREKGLITNEQARQVREFKLAWDDAKDAVAGFFNTLAGNWAPALTKFSNRLETFVAWMRSHKTLIQGFALGVTLALTGIAAVLWGAYIPAWIAAAVAVLAATWPILAIVAAVALASAAFALLWEDVQAFLKGQPSLLGDLVNKYGWVRKAVELIGATFKSLQHVGAAAWEVLKGAGVIAAGAFRLWWAVAGPILRLVIDLVKLFGAVVLSTVKFSMVAFGELFKFAAAVAEPALQLIGAMLEWLGGIFGQVAKAVWGEWGAMFDRFVERVKGVIDLVRGLMGLVEGARQGLDRVTAHAKSGGVDTTLPAQGVSAGQAQVNASRRVPLGAQTSNSVTARTNVQKRTDVKIDKVEVKTQATDADGMAKAASGALTSHIRRAQAHFDDGVER